MTQSNWGVWPNPPGNETILVEILKRSEVREWKTDTLEYSQTIERALLQNEQRTCRPSIMPMM